MLQILQIIFFANAAFFAFAGEFTNITVPGPTGGTVEAGQPLKSIVLAHPDFDDYDVSM
jgi:hypothetical protein